MQQPRDPAGHVRWLEECWPPPPPWPRRSTCSTPATPATPSPCPTWSPTTPRPPAWSWGVRQTVDGIDLRLVGCVLELGGRVRATAAGAAALGHPAAAVAWLVRALHRRGRGLSAGDVVLSGGLTEAVAVAPGDVVVARLGRLGTVELAVR